MAPRIAEALANPALAFVKRTTLLKDDTRRETLAATFAPHHPNPSEHIEALRRLAGETRRETLAHLDHWLGVFSTQATARGMVIHRAPDAEAARRITVDIARRIGAKTAVKAKSMVTEECRILDALLEAGVDTFETDLGELVLQLDDDAPSHLVAPMIHKDRHAAARALSRLDADSPLPADPTSLTRHARHALRPRFETADLGLTGANFLVAETGEIVTCTNEGNGRLTTVAPRVHIAITGIEKVVADLDHLSLLLELLARSSTGQPLTVYTSFTSGPAPLGPAEVHLILVDNGRSRIHTDPTFADALGCIRCGACLNACPVYRTIGGHAYGSVWPGPIGQVLTPLLRGPATSPDLPWASTLCGACREACPVDIDLPGMLLALRARAHRERRTPAGLRWALKLVRTLLGGRLRFRFALAAAGTDLARRHGPARAFTHGPRSLPRPSPRPFHAVWKAIRRARKRHA
jgi:L-lactate dehydrogenase complex protein LldF